MCRNDLEAAELKPSPVLGEAKVARRQLLLADVQAVLERRGVHAVQARHQRLALSGASLKVGPSGLTDPVLHVFAVNGMRKVTTDGVVFLLDDGAQFPVAEAAALAAVIAAVSETSSA